MQIPHTALSPEALQNLLEEFVTREGTDYGAHVYSLDDKVRHVLRQIETGRAVILYDPRTSTSHIEVRERVRPDSDDDAYAEGGRGAGEGGSGAGDGGDDEQRHE